MLFNRLVVKPIDIDIDLSKYPLCKSCKLIHVTGSGALSSTTKSIDHYSNTFEYEYLTQMKLNNIPLIQINSSACPTCESILATGYGIDKADCNELNLIREKINSEFTSLDNTIEILDPLLKLLESGLYVIADAICYPTNGDNTFFWDAPNQPTINPATAGVFLNEYDYTYVDGHPAFLYPTQDTNCFDESRVRYYVEQFKKSKNPPRAIVYNCKEFLNFIIDGHHKACAAALLGIPLHCIAIIPFTGYGYQNIDDKLVKSTLYFSPVKVNVSDIPSKYLPKDQIIPTYSRSIYFTSGNINHRNWGKSYLDTAKKYPSVFEYADMVESGIVSVTDEIIKQCITNLNDENQQIMKTILFILQNKNDPRLKKTAINCAKQLSDCNLKMQAYKVLCTFKNDSEVEQFFIDHFVYNEDKNSTLTQIAKSYWD